MKIEASLVIQEQVNFSGRLETQCKLYFKKIIFFY